MLLDGRRLQPSTSALAVDINTIPAALIDSVEVITGGASAAYGADAVSGVVNFKLKKNFQGVQFDGYYGISERGDNRIIDVSAAMGGNFADNRGNAVISLSYSDRGEVQNRDIKFLQKGFAVGAVPASSSFLSTGYYNPIANQPTQAALDSYFGQFGAAAGRGDARDAARFQQRPVSRCSTSPARTSTTTRTRSTRVTRSTRTRRRARRRSSRTSAPTRSRRCR